MTAANGLDPSIDAQSPDLTPEGEANLLAGTVRELGKDTLLYLLGASVIGLAGFVLIPLYTRCLTLAGFGGLALIEIGLTVMMTVAQLGFGTSYLKWYADLPRSKHAQLLGTSLLVTLASGGVGGIIFSLFVASQAGWMWVRITDRSFAWILAPLVLIETLQALLLSDIRARRKPLQFCAVAVVRLIVMTGLGIWLVGVLKLGLNGALLGRLLGTTVGVLMLSGLSFWRRPISVDLRLLRGMLSYGLPLVWSSVMAISFDATGRSLLSSFSGLAQLGTYALALKISNVIQMFFLVPFGTAWSGMVFAIAHKSDAPRMYTRILGHALVFLAAMAAMLMIVTPVFLPVVSPGEYSPAARLVPWLLVPLILRILEYWSCTGIYLTHNTKWIAYIATGDAIINLGFGRWLVVSHGAFGVAWAWIAALTFGIIIMAVLSLRVYPMPLDWSVLFFAGGIWLFGFLIARLLPVRFSAVNTICAFAATSVIAAALVFYLRAPIRQLLHKA